MNIEEEEFQDEFSTFGVNLESEDIVAKLRDLCQLFRLDAGDIAMEWVAYSSSHNNCKLTQDTLDLMERERLTKKARKGPAPASSGNKFGKSVVHSIDTIESVVDGSDSILDAYSTPNGKTTKKRLHSTPENPVNKRLTGLNGSPAVPFSPRSFSPGQSTPTASKKYESRTNAGEVLCPFGPENKVWSSKRSEPVDISLHDPERALSGRYKYMFQKLMDKATVLNDIIDDLGESIQSTHKIEEFSHVSLPAQEEVTVVGRICCDAQGKLNAKSVLLEGSRQTSSGKQIAVDLSELKQYALFPGQVVAMTGLNTMGNRFVAKKLHDNTPLPPSEHPKLSDGPLSVLIATGPYSTSDNLAYEPLADLIKVIQREAPDVCILIGPMLDIKNPEVENGQFGETFDERFTSIVTQVSQHTKKSQLVFVPSYRDAHHDPVYPQPPYMTNSDPRVHFASDPSVIQVAGVNIGITSTDVLLQLGSEEISYPPGSSDRLSRLTNHLFTQRSFYPLYPPADDMNIDYPQQCISGALEETPHIMVVPSDLRYFLKDINGCCCINPGRLTKGQIGGTYAKVLVRPSEDEKPIVQRISAQVVRI